MLETRALPEVKAGDYLVLHDTGGHMARQCHPTTIAVRCYQKFCLIMVRRG